MKTIKAICPKCGQANCFNVWNEANTVKGINVDWFRCSFCFLHSDKSDWKDV